MNVTAVQLNFETPLRIGKRGLGEEATLQHIPSDTLFSAIINGYSKLYGIDEASNLVELFINGNPPFIISSAFPFFRTDKTDYVYTFPKPMLPFKKKVTKQKDFLRFKKIKKARYVTITVLEQLIFNKITFADILSEISKDPPTFVVDHSLIMTAKEAEKIIPKEREDGEKRWPIVDQISSHNTLDRLGLSSQIFFTKSVVFDTNAGLYFLVRFLDESLKNRFWSTLKLLEDEGIGGNRSIGSGFFNYKFDNLTLQVPSKDEINALLLLSRYVPKDNELPILFAPENLNFLYFETAEVGGYIQTPIGKLGERRPRIRLFTEGSVLPLLHDSDLLGCTVKLRDMRTHKVVRYGYGFTVGIIYE